MPNPNEQMQGRSEADIEAELATLLPIGHEDDETPLENEGGGASNNAPGPDAAIVAEATRKGWVPKDQYKGDPDKWVDAAKFVDRGNKFAKNLQREVDTLKKQLADFEGTKQQFIKFTQERLAAKDAELKDAIAALRIQTKAAIRDGDDELANTLEDRIDVLKGQRDEVKNLPDEVPAPSNKVNMDDPVLNDWIADGNEWFRDDEKMREYAVALGNELVTNGDNIVDGKPLKGRKFLNLVRERMEEEFPRRFKKSSTATGGRTDPVAGASGGATSHTGRITEADLTPADRALMRTLIKDGYYTKESFLKSFSSR